MSVKHQNTTIIKSSTKYHIHKMKILLTSYLQHTVLHVKHNTWTLTGLTVNLELPNTVLFNELLLLKDC